MKISTSKALQPFYYSIILALGFIAGSLTVDDVGYNKINDVINVINTDYVDTIDIDKLNDIAVNGILQALDPHSYYVSAEEFAEANDDLQGEFDGIGVQFRIQNDTITVVNTISGGPSEKNGILPGDRIVKIENEIVAGIKIKEKEVISKLKGPRGTNVNIDVFRRGFNKLLNFTIIRDVIPTYSVDVAYMITSQTAYMRVSKFSATTHLEMLAELKKLKYFGMQNLIIDLRGNGGGYMESAVDMSNELLPEGKTIVFTKGKNRKTEFFKSDGKGTFKQGELIILIDELSASASEIVAGAIQDNDRGLIIGRRSFGKGLVQSQLKFKDGSAIRLTVARYYTPSGRCIQKPYNEGSDMYYSQFYTALYDENNDETDTSKIDEALKYKTVKGRTVYGGGGIMPDIIVANEKDSLLYWYYEVSNLGLVYRFAFDLTDKHRSKLSSIKTVAEFDNYFNINDNTYDKFVFFAKENGAKLFELDNDLSKTKICELIKSYVARNTLGDKGFYPIFNKQDKVVQKALEVFESTSQ